MKTEKKLNELLTDIKSLVVGKNPNLDEAMGKVNELFKTFHAPTIMQNKEPYIDEVFQSAYEFLSQENVAALIQKYEFDSTMNKEQFLEKAFNKGIGDIELIEDSLEIEYPPDDYFTLVDYREKQDDFHVRIWDIKEHMNNMPPI